MKVDKVDGASPRSNLVEISKMRKLEDARRKWESRHCSNSPFRAENYASSNSIGMNDTGSDCNSPLTAGKSYGLRLGVQKGQKTNQL